ncbi:MAG: hypothetical protein M0Z90_06305 [Desulfobacteraceae bacterium]|nr:hypothetical protein [Desulfobacteraceae bacterium]
MQTLQGIQYHLGLGGITARHQLGEGSLLSSGEVRPRAWRSARKDSGREKVPPGS